MAPRQQNDIVNRGTFWVSREIACADHHDRPAMAPRRSGPRERVAHLRTSQGRDGLAARRTLVALAHAHRGFNVSCGLCPPLEHAIWPRLASIGECKTIPPRPRARGTMRNEPLAFPPSPRDFPPLPRAAMRIFAQILTPHREKLLARDFLRKLLCCARTHCNEIGAAVHQAPPLGAVANTRKDTCL